MDNKNVSYQDDQLEVTAFPITQISRPKKKPLEKHERRVIAAYIVFSVALLFSYHQAMQWGAYAFRAPVLQVKQMLGSLDSKGYVELATICYDRANAKCVKQTYRNMYQVTKNVEALAMLAQFQARNHEQQEAIKNFDEYFKRGGKNPQVPLQYALVLEDVRNFDASVIYLNRAIQQNSGRQALLPTAEMLKIYMSQQKYSQAQRLLESFWARTDKQHAYFNSEESQLRQYLGPQKTAGL